MNAKVIAVHGTYVADASDTGEQWWQKSGVFDRYLRHRMSDAVDELIVFHWSGANSAAARETAGLDLFRQMQALERQQIPYHIVAHSHGGGVLLEALTDAILARAPLSNLVSWTTVGTPFICASPASHWTNRLRNPWRMMLALSLAMINMTTIALLAASPFIAIPIPAIVLLSGLLLWTTTLSGRISANGHLLSRLEARKEAMNQFGNRWLPLWSTGDEALTSLTVTVPPMTLNLVGPIRPSVNRHAPLRSLIRWPLASAVALGVNAFRPRLNRTAAATVRRALQGYDHPFGDVENIGAGPLPPFDAYPSLPPRVDAELIESANANAQQGIAALRTALYTAAMAGDGVPGFTSSLQAQLRGGELVHTRYFEHDEIVRIIELHMRGSWRSAEGELQTWFESVRSTIDDAVRLQSSSWIYRES